MDMLHETYQLKRLPLSTCMAILTLILKNDKEMLKNYRPISLNDYDYKIISSALSCRLQKIVSKLISHDHTAYIKGRYIGYTAQLLQDVIKYCKTSNLPGAILSLDFQKAVDSLEWPFMMKTLNKFGFGRYFQTWKEILYKDPKLVVKNNGWLSKTIEMKCGIRQGCSLSALLFIIASEILTLKLKSCKEIQGIKFNNFECLVCQYADDTTLVLGSVQFIKESGKIMKECAIVSGLKLNIE